MRATLVNASQSETSIAVWVDFAGGPASKPVAWISALLSPNCYAVYEWQAAYELVWADTGKLLAGKTVNAAQRLPTAPAGGAARLEKQGGGYRLVAVSPAVPPDPGTLLVETSADVPAEQLAVGVNIRILSGMGAPGDAAGVAQAGPNLTYRWTTGETYYANAGAITQSEYDPPALQTQTPLKLDFAGGSDVGILLDQANILHQLGNAQLAEIASSAAFVRMPAAPASCRRCGATAATIEPDS